MSATNHAAPEYLPVGLPDRDVKAASVSREPTSRAVGMAGVAARPVAESADGYGCSLFDGHQELLARSAISPHVVRERGYVSVDRKVRLEKLGFSVGQRTVPGLLIPIHDVNGRIAFHQYRPDVPRLAGDGRQCKYETPSGSKIVIDVPPRVRHLLSDGDVPLYVTEGARKADAAATAGLCCVALLGVWGFAREGVALRCWDSITLDGRDVYIAFDSDVMVKRSVQGALRRLRGFLVSRGATVHLLFLDGQPSAELLGDSRPSRKIGLDDFLASGRSVQDLLATEGRLPERRKDADELVDLAKECFEFGTDQQGEPFALVRYGPLLALPFRGSRTAFRSSLARLYVKTHNTVPSSSALADAVRALEGEALEAPPVETHVRVARWGPSNKQPGAVIDLGTPQSDVVVVGANGWEVQRRSPGPVFRRTNLMSALPTPVRGGDLEVLRKLINIGDSTNWGLLVGWLVAALLADVPQPILLLRGEQGAGKTTAARLLAQVLDPSGAELRGPPKNEDDWSVTAANSMVVGIDNITYIPQWLSDALCRCVTGGGQVKRRLYTDSELNVLSFRRAVILTGIDLGRLRGDVIDRLLPVELTRIDEFRTDHEIQRTFQRKRASILGSLLDLVADVLRLLPSVQVDRRLRMQDFAAVLASIDQLHGTNSLSDYRRLTESAFSDAVEADAVAAAVEQFMTQQGSEWKGEPTELFEKLTPSDKRYWPADWPADAARLTTRLNRCLTALRVRGITVESKRSHGRRTISLHRVTESSSGASNAESVTSPSPSNPPPSPDGEESPAPKSQVREGSVDEGDAGDAGDARFPRFSVEEVVDPSQEDRGHRRREGVGIGASPASPDASPDLATLHDLPLPQLGTCRRCKRTCVTGDAHGPVHRSCPSIEDG